MNSKGDRFRAVLILGLSFIFSLIWFGRYLSFSPVASVDLPGHVALIERLAANLLHGRLFFYDHWWFGGWPAYQFYGFFGHLLTVLLLPFTAVLSREPAQLAAHIVMLLGCSALPFSMYFAANSLIDRKSAQAVLPRFNRSIIALAAVVFSFWYLNQPLDFFGVGAASLWHGGLYLQIFSWHLSLLLWGVLFQILQAKNPGVTLLATLLLAALILTHIFAAVFSLLLILLAFFRFDQARGRLLFVTVMAAALSAFWWLPMLVTAGDYTLAHSEPPQGDLFEMVLHQPFSAFFISMYKLVRMQFVPVEIAPLLFILIALATLSSRRFWESPLQLAFSIFGLLLLIVLSSPYIASSFPLGLHYYRFSSFLLLYLLMLTAACSAQIFRQKEGWSAERMLRSAYLILCVLSISMTAAIGVLRGRAVSKIDERASFKSQHAVLAQLRNSSPATRVAFEYFRDRQKFSFLSPHFMESALASAAGRETTNGLYIQSSLSTQFVAANLKALGFEAYRVPVPWPEADTPNRSLALEQLREVGIGKLVVSAGPAADALKTDSPQPPFSSGPYEIISLSEAPLPLIERINKTVVTYGDRSGDVPFTLLENLFRKDAEIYHRAMLLTGDEAQLAELPSAIHLRHSASGTKQEASFQLPHDVRAFFERFAGRNMSGLANELATEFEKSILPQLRALSLPEPITDDGKPPPEVDYSSAQQSFYLKNLQPGVLYRLAYSYFPYFEVTGGKLFRADGEQMVVLAEDTVMKLHYSRLGNPLVLSATLVSSCSLLLILAAGLWVRLRGLRPLEDEPNASPEVPVHE